MKNNEKSEKEYDRVPKDYLKDVFIVPYNFDDPENPEHAKYVHEQSRHDLFYDAYDKISKVEQEYLKGEDDYFLLSHINPCNQKKTWIEKLLTKKYVNSEEDNLLRCEDWTIKNGEKNTIFRVKTYQSNNDRFYTLVFPPSLRKYFFLYKNHGGII